VCRLPNGDFSTLLKILESVTQKVQEKNKWLILCGDWNINFIQESVRLYDMQELLSLHNLVKVVSGFGGQWLACWPLVPKLVGSNPAEAVGFFGRNNPQHAFFRRGSLSHVAALRHVKEPSNYVEVGFSD
jgi:hypothetical protein